VSRKRGSPNVVAPLILAHPVGRNLLFSTHKPNLKSKITRYEDTKATQNVFFLAGGRSFSDR